MDKILIFGLFTGGSIGAFIMWLFMDMKVIELEEEIERLKYKSK